MKKCFRASLFLLLISGLASPSFADGNIFQGARLGGGFLWNNKVQSPLKATGALLHLAADLKMYDAVNIVPFYEFSRRNSMNTSLAGGDIQFHLPLAGGSGSFFVGPGAGFVHTSEQDTTSAGMGSGYTSKKTKMLLDGTAGVEYAFTPRVGLFLEGKYAWAPSAVNGIMAFSGLTFHFNRD